MRLTELQRRIMIHQKTYNMEYLLELTEYKKNPKKLYKQLITLQEKTITPTGRRVTKYLLDDFIKLRSPDEYPEIWI